MSSVLSIQTIKLCASCVICAYVLIHGPISIWSWMLFTVGVRTTLSTFEDLRCFFILCCCSNRWFRACSSRNASLIRYNWRLKMRATAVIKDLLQTISFVKAFISRSGSVAYPYFLTINMSSLPRWTVDKTDS